MKQIIIVEDDVGILETMTIILRKAGHAVTGFFNGASILSGNYSTPDMFIIDKQLHGGDGIDLCRFIKSQEATRHIPVMMISANPSVIQLAVEAHADDALEKPFKLKELRERVAGLLEKTG